jgi:hypothetical protein
MVMKEATFDEILSDFIRDSLAAIPAKCISLRSHFTTAGAAKARSDTLWTSS